MFFRLMSNQNYVCFLYMIVISDSINVRACMIFKNEASNANKTKKYLHTNNKSVINIMLTESIHNGDGAFFQKLCQYFALVHLI